MYFFYLIEQHSKFLLHTLKVLFMCILCDSIVTDQHSWNVSTQNAFSLPFAAILVNCAPSGEMHNYCTLHIIKENFKSFLIHRFNYLLLSQVYCLWQVLKTPTIILNNSVYIYMGDRGGTVVKVLCYKSEGCWFDSRWCHWNFSLT